MAFTWWYEVYFYNSLDTNTYSESNSWGYIINPNGDSSTIVL